MTGATSEAFTWLGLLLVALGGALGGASRHCVSGWIGARLGEDFPFGTLAVNLSGALLAGALFGMLAPGLGTAWLVLGVGVLGSYTTVSALSLQVLQLGRGGRPAHATGYLLLTFALGLPAVWLGHRLALHWTA